ncbi:MAG: hypothetical protein R6V01_09930 [Thermoplasmatota archaeon]
MLSMSKNISSNCFSISTTKSNMEFSMNLVGIGLHLALIYIFHLVEDRKNGVLGFDPGDLLGILPQPFL